MAAITKQDTRLKLQFVANADHSIHAGIVAVEAIFDLWNKLRKLSCLDPRKDRKRGFGPEVIVVQVDLRPVLGRGLSLRQRGAQ